MPYQCECGKEYSSIEDLINCAYSGHEQFPDVEMQMRNLLNVAPNAVGMAVYISDRITMFRIDIEGGGSLDASSYQGLVEQVQKTIKEAQNASAEA